MAARGKKDEEVESPAEEGTAEKRSPAKSAEERSPLDSLSDGLDGIIPGLEILDRELSLEGARADLVAVDPAGRLHLVQIANEDGDKAAIEVLDTLRVLRSNLELFARHCGESRVNPERAPRLVVVSVASDTALPQRLSVLADAGVSVVGLRSVKSASGERAYLVRLDDPARPAGAAGGVGAFLRALPARLEPLGAALVEKMERLDEELSPSADSTTVVWRLGGEVLCRVERVGELLQASVAPRHEPLPLADQADLEQLVERALARLMRVLGLTRGGRPAGEDRPAGPARSEPLLTEEEIQAFRQ